MTLVRALRRGPGYVLGALHWRASRVLRPLAPCADDPYSTHVPVLVALAALRPVRRVLEFGSGRHSTLTFLDRLIFPEVVEVSSYETDPLWRREVLAMAAGDARLAVSLVPGPMHEMATRVDVRAYDLVLVDDSTDMASRAATIAAVSMRPIGNAIVVVHDYENTPYREAARGLRARHALTAFTPQTGVGWDEASLDPRHLRALDRVLRRFAPTVPSHDRTLWQRVLRENWRLQ